MLMFLTCIVVLLVMNTVRLECKLEKALNIAERRDALLRECRHTPSHNEAEVARHNDWLFTLTERIEQLRSAMLR